ncbi:hypothetical protein [Hyalangium rubrum]|uniref:Lipoprotein n=1 Tax=Hyalangium rubrum TaxID=3103134 RepID=A0ABU5GYZ0_9BACT|nr:hypothetical protein [Hyalangium sp. s54d21]MDY7226399.1 hypothetical protein [Hyalangium sp. s54d21]
MALALLTACASTTPRVSANLDSYERELDAAHYSLSEFTVGDGEGAPVEVGREDFQKALAELARSVPFSAHSMESARQLFAQEHEVEFLAQVKEGQVVWAVPLEPGSTARPRDWGSMTRNYLQWCDQEQGGGDCIGLLEDGPTLRGDDLRTLGLAIALGSVLREMKSALVEAANPRALLLSAVWSVGLYLLMWVVPEPLTKGVAAMVTAALMAWLGVDTVWRLMTGWVDLVGQADSAESFAELGQAGGRYGKVLGEHVARVLVMVVAAALGGTAARLAEKLPRLPGYSQAAVQAETQGSMPLSMVVEVESVAASPQGSFSVLMRGRRGSGGAASSGARGEAVTLIHHQGGNRQVMIHGQRWHVPANRSVKDIPRHDPVGDELQAVTTRVAETWSPARLNQAERDAIRDARSQGKHWLAHLLEREARGRYVHAQVVDQFKQVRWNRVGVDAIDPRTGYKYELLTRSSSNLARHGRRMAEELFRMVSF